MAVRTVRRLLVRGALGGTLAILASGVGSVALAADHGVDIASFAFSPGSVTIAVGDTVTWTNGDPQNHTATADDSSWDTSTIANGASKSITFGTAGTFGYHCAIHPAMTGTVVVAAAAPPTDTVSAAAVAPGSRSIPTWSVLGLAALFGIALARRRFANRN